ncbi:MAG TPA: four helix bundle protein [Candidatus Moranbacteria bacterium]|nr:MAG: S23 ribosomal protein family protein [Candidatus Moranbacteria bacterium GW2011_GWC2_45_10]KKT93074.1 MAG: s23 ribosomal protein [Parcubacteria group bacterium GW2011_GWC1_45_14]HAV11695.1 four helix bundle protein [Candidatus Moranbacteria bacterium]
MEKSNSYKDLLVWQKSIDLVVDIYELTEKFPKSEAFGLVSQMRRAAVAIPSNIAEGQKRGHKKEFLQFLYISYGSGAELETQLEICKRLGKLKELDYTVIEAKLEEIMKMLNSLIRSVKDGL